MTLLSEEDGCTYDTMSQEGFISSRRTSDNFFIIKTIVDKYLRRKEHISVLRILIEPLTVLIERVCSIQLEWSV